MFSSQASGVSRSGASTGRASSRPRMLDSVMASGWSAVTYPEVLCSIALEPGHRTVPAGVIRYSAMARAVQRLHTPILKWFLACPSADRRAFLWQVIRNPAGSVSWVARRAIRAWRAPPRVVELPATAVGRNHPPADSPTQPR